MFKKFDICVNKKNICKWDNPEILNFITMKCVPIVLKKKAIENLHINNVIVV